MEKEPVIFYEVCDGSESSVDSEELVDVKIGGKGENPGISSSTNNDYSTTDANSAKTISSNDFFSLEILSNDFFQARKVNFDESSASEFASKYEQIDASHGSIGGERENPETSRSDNNDYLVIHTNGIKSVLIQDEASSCYSSSESLSDDFLQARKVKFAKLSASESESKDEDSDISHKNSKSTRGERKNLDISRSGGNNYLKTDTNDSKRILVPNETSSPSSSSESSVTDFSQTRKANFVEFPSSKVASKDGESGVSRQKFITSETGSNFPVHGSTSPIYTLKRGHRSMSPTVAPPVQVMDRSPEYNSHRIPSSVFAVTTNPTDWTNDSDESLFSIQIGNPSFARDHLFTTPELRKSVELTKSGELNLFSPRPSVLIEDRDTCRKSFEIEDSQTSEMSDEDFKLEGSLDKNKNKNSRPAISYKSHCNGIGAQFSALPKEKKQEAPSSCSCLKCSLALCCCWHASPVSPDVENHNSVQTYNPQVTSDSTSNCCNLCECFSWLCCTCCSYTDSPCRLSCEESSKKTSRSTSSCCSCFKCSFGSSCSWNSCCCCSETDGTRHQSLDKASEKTSSSWSWSCCSWGCCCSETYRTRQKSLGKASEETSSSWSWSCCSWDSCCCCCSETDSTRQKSLGKASEETSSSWSWSCCSWDSCCCCCSETDSTRQKSLGKASEETSRPWFWFSSCCSWDSCCCCCSETDSTRQKSLGKASEETSRPWFWSSSCCSWDSCCGCCSEKDSRHQSLDKASEEASSSWFWSWSCCSWDSNSSCCCCCCCSETDSTRHQSLDKAFKKAPSCWSWSWSWSWCLSKENCSETNTPRHQSFLKTSEKTYSSASNCCGWTCCSCCCC